MDFGAVVADGLGAEGCLRVTSGFGGGGGAAVVVPSVGGGRLGDVADCRGRGVAVGVGVGVGVRVGVCVGAAVRVGVGCVMPVGGGRCVPCSCVTNAQTPTPPRTSTAAPPAIHGARRRGRR
ncbi:hypothetical protein [Streptomyces sp. BK340]|uniref:hypothetical protein n=1 Tax=Streptomyces sp. BK340 TaxID=2572903 RepID=UPI0016451E86|nr:hypothetical protein [Streptomyces sp. BK340]